MTSPTILVVRMSSDTDGPNRLPGRSRLTLFRSNTGMSSGTATWRRWRGGPGLRRRPGLRDDDGRCGAGSRRLHVVPVCERRQARNEPVLARRSPRLARCLACVVSVYVVLMRSWCSVKFVVIHSVCSRTPRALLTERRHLCELHVSCACCTWMDSLLPYYLSNDDVNDEVANNQRALRLGRESRSICCTYGKLAKSYKLKIHICIQILISFVYTNFKTAYR